MYKNRPAVNNVCNCVTCIINVKIVLKAYLAYQEGAYQCD